MYSDIVGPMKCESMTGAKYFITFIDDCSRWCEVYFLKTKNKALEAFKMFKNHAETFTGRKIKYLQTDNGGEYCSKEFNEYLHREGISRRLIVPRTPQQNGVAERMNRTLIEMARCMLLGCELSSGFWAEAIDTACYIRNRCPTSSLGDNIPYVKWVGKPLKIHYLRKFGAKVHILDKNPQQDKFAARAIEGVFVGYPKTNKGFRVWVPENRKFVISRDIKFYEEKTLGQLLPVSNIEDQNTKDDIEKKFINIILDNEGTENIQHIETNNEPEKGTDEIIISNQQLRNEIVEEDIRSEIETSIVRDITTKRAPGRPKILRTGQVGRPKKEYRVVELDERLIDNDTMNTDLQFETLQDNAKLKDSSDESFTDCVDFIGTAEISLEDALKGEACTKWKEAILSEIRSLVKHDTWDVVKRPPNKNIVGSRYVLTTKVNIDKTIKHKARLVAQGYSQRFGVDYHKTYAPVVKLDTVRLLMALSVELNLEIHQLDINTAYLNGFLDEEIYMKTPKLLKECLLDLVNNEKEDASVVERANIMLNNLNSGCDVCLLKKSLYGLKQAGRQWNQRLDKKLKDMGLYQSLNEPCFYMRKHEDEHLFVLVFVDDILVASQKEDRISRFKNELKNEFEFKDYGQAKYFLGIDINRRDNAISLSQQNYISELIIKYGLCDSKVCSTPMEIGSCKPIREELTNVCEQQSSEREKYPYRELIGSLMYLSTATRPDITNSVTKLAQFSNKPERKHWLSAKRILRYLKGTMDYGLTYKKTGKSIEGYCDADWGIVP